MKSKNVSKNIILKLINALNIAGLQLRNVNKNYNLGELEYLNQRKEKNYFEKY